MVCKEGGTGVASDGSRRKQHGVVENPIYCAHAYMHAYIHTYIHTVRHRGMGTGISEASKRFFLCYPGRQTNEFLFDRATGSKPERLRSGSLQAGLSLMV